MRAEAHKPLQAEGGRNMRRWLIGGSVAFMLMTLAGAHADERWRDGERQGFPFTERFEGTRTWKPDRDLRRQGVPDRFVIDRPGKCEVRCERVGREYRCKEYRC